MAEGAALFRPPIAVTRGKGDMRSWRRSSSRQGGDRMRRRDFITLISGAAIASTCCAHAQEPAKVWRVGEVLPTTPERGGYLAQAIEQSLADLGYVQGRNILLSNRFAGPQPDELREVIRDLLPQIDLLVAWGTVGGAAKEVADDMPTVFVSVGAPVEIGLVQSLAHPGGNMTGISFEAATETMARDCKF